MSTTNYVTVTNNAIEESGADLATFNTGGADWTSNTNTLMNRMKRYVARAWRDIQQEAFDWGFLEEQAVVNINPGVMFYTDGTDVSSFQTIPSTSTIIYDQDGSVAIPDVPVKSIYNLTGISTYTKPFGYVDITTTASSPITWSLKPGAEYFALSTAITFGWQFIWEGSTFASTLPNGGINIDLTFNGTTYLNAGLLTAAIADDQATFLTNNTQMATALQAAIPSSGTFPTIIISEHGGTTSGTIAAGVSGSNGGASITNDNAPYIVSGTGKCFVHSWKSFNFSEETGIDDFQENIKEVDQKSFRTIDYFKAPATGEVPLEYVPWEAFQRLYDISSAPPSIPRTITRDNTGRFRLYPHPYYTFTLKFDYTRTPQDVSAYNDVFKGLDEDYIDIVMWKALIYYGEFDEQPSVVARATKNYKNFLTRLEQLYRQKFHFGPARLY